MLPSGNGYKSTSPGSCHQGKRNSRGLSLTRQCLKLIPSWCGFDGWQLSLPTRNSLNKHIQGKKHVCGRVLPVTPIRKAWEHHVSTGGGTWYPQACQFLKLRHHIHSPYEKSIIERRVQYIKDRTECFDDYFPCRLKKCTLKHVRNWLNLFVDHHNKELKTLK
jgi:hypothetical protein